MGIDQNKESILLVRARRKILKDGVKDLFGVSKQNVGREKGVCEEQKLGYKIARKEKKG